MLRLWFLTQFELNFKVKISFCHIPVETVRVGLNSLICSLILVYTPTGISIPCFRHFYAQNRNQSRNWNPKEDHISGYGYYGGKMVPYVSGSSGSVASATLLSSTIKENIQ
jgi:hypothetical protein